MTHAAQIGTICALSLVALGVGCSTSHPSYTYTSTPQDSTRYADTSSQRSQSYASEASTNLSGDTVIPLYEESVAVGTREVDAGSVRLRKRVTTETVNQPVQLRRETLVIDREPASGQSSQAASSSAPGQAFQENETVINLKREEPVVEKRVIQSGRIVVQKKAQPQQQTVQQQIRREDIQVEKIGNPENVIISENLRSRTEATGATGSAAGSTQGAGTNNTSTNSPSNAPYPPDAR